MSSLIKRKKQTAYSSSKAELFKTFERREEKSNKKTKKEPAVLSFHEEYFGGDSKDEDCDMETPAQKKKRERYEKHGGSNALWEAFCKLSEEEKWRKPRLVDGEIVFGK